MTIKDVQTTCYRRHLRIIGEKKTKLDILHLSSKIDNRGTVFPNKNQRNLRKGKNQLAGGNAMEIINIETKIYCSFVGWRRS